MRILIVSNYKLGVGGISGQVELLQQKLRAEGHVVDVFSTKASFWKRLWMMPKLRRYAKDYDVMHIHCCSGWGFLPAVLGVTVGKQLGKRTVLTYHGGGGETFFAKHSTLVRHYLLRTDANIVLSGFLAKVFEQYQLPYTIIPNIIKLDEACFRSREVIRPNYICVRAHEPLYNIPCILRAFQRVQQMIPEASLMLVGDGSQHKILMQQAEAMGLQNVVFTGRVNNNEIYKYLDQADIMLSAPKVDNMPVSLIEAMNAGLLVISSNVGGVPYMIKDGKTGLLFDSNDDKALASLMQWAVLNQEASIKIIRNAKQEVSKYHWEEVGKRIKKLYE